MIYFLPCQALTASQEQQVVREREAKRQAGVRYQQELDEQLGAIRSKSLKELTQTMTDDELRYNSDLIRKTGLALDVSA